MFWNLFLFFLFLTACNAMAQARAWVGSGITGVRQTHVGRLIDRS
jgi:hypothetical protein